MAFRTRSNEYRATVNICRDDANDLCLAALRRQRAVPVSASGCASGYSDGAVECVVLQNVIIEGVAAHIYVDKGALSWLPAQRRNHNGHIP